MKDLTMKNTVFDKQFWLVLGGMFAAMIGMIWFIIFMVSLMLEGVTVEGIAESAGRTMQQIEQSYDKGKQSQ